jgi:transposase InsO family protein
MRVTIQFESHRVELAAIYDLEHDPDVLEYYDQPPTFKLDYQSASGRQLGVLHTADFFVIRKSGAGWEECKTQDELVHLSRHNENRYRSDDETAWRCPPGESYAATYGLYYRVRCSRDIHWVFQRNIQFMEDYFRGDRRCAGSAMSWAHERIAGAVSISCLPTAHADRPTTSFAIAAGASILTFAQHLGRTHQGRRICGPEVVRTAACCRYSRRRPPGKTPTTVIEARLSRASENDLSATRDCAVRRAAWKGRGPGRSGGRTPRRWIVAYCQAEAKWGAGTDFSRTGRGNSMAKLPETSRTLIEETIAADYETLKQKTVYASWLALKLACDQKGVALPSYKTYRLAVRRRPVLEQTLKRQGPRAAYQQEAAYWELEFRTPPHGDRPFEIAHIDHTELDVECVCSRTGRGLGRPWLTLLTDAYSRRMLALYLTFDAPSYRSCMMVLRECVRRHSRLPQIIVVDGGREFQSTYFETLLARYEVTKKTRPPARPRFGSVCERLFGTANTQFLHNPRQYAIGSERGRSASPSTPKVRQFGRSKNFSAGSPSMRTRCTTSSVTQRSALAHARCTKLA